MCIRDSPGCLLAHSRRACAVNNLPDSQIGSNPIILSIDAVMSMMNSYHLEPAHIAVYYPDQIKPLVDALWDGTVEGGINGLSYVAESYPYSPITCLLYTSPSPRDRTRSRMPSSA
eukprot:TRINITY_DN40484_c0_g1_i1.p1 TRINITY_DN40484_c0_g1~~TRINITY_DN40484_c0_g1_i1.p1  ORF type:complete len:116 (-),score=14.43 TRINITY_DN40484_c0_g1_i1:28-375(-)